ncbi:MAG TPA: hypothetical protein PLJ40_04715 [Paludibacteraceae bacterium]|nr:hypothetical protein [Paludibacteraceae bacterium]
MKDLLTFLVLWIGVNAYSNPTPYFAPTPKIRYIDLELPTPISVESHFILSNEYSVHATYSKYESRIYAPITTIGSITLEQKHNYSSIISDPFSTTANELCPPSQISTNGVDFGGGDIEFGTTDWGDGEEEEPGYDPYPINNDFEILSFLIFIYALSTFSKKHRNLRYKTNHHETSI